MNRLRIVCIDAIERHDWHYAICCTAIPYVTTTRQEFYLANINASDGYLVFETRQMATSTKPRTISDSWFQL